MFVGQAGEFTARSGKWMGNERWVGGGKWGSGHSSNDKVWESEPHCNSVLLFICNPAGSSNGKGDSNLIT